MSAVGRITAKAWENLCSRKHEAASLVDGSRLPGAPDPAHRQSKLLQALTTCMQRQSPTPTPCHEGHAVHRSANLRCALLAQVGDIWYTTDGQCYDEMNRNLWMVLLNAIMQTADGAWPLDAGGSRMSSSRRRGSSNSSSSSESGDDELISSGNLEANEDPEAF